MSHSYLQQIRQLGATHALQQFATDTGVPVEKLAAWGEGGVGGDIGTTAAGAVPLFGPALAGLVSGHTTPISPEGVSALTSEKATQHGLIGGGLGAAGGAGIGALLGLLRQQYGVGPNITPGQGAGYGAALGGGLGLMAGGAHGALRGRHEAEHAAVQDVEQEMRNLEATIRAVEHARNEGANEGYQAALSGWGAGL